MAVKKKSTKKTIVKYDHEQNNFFQKLMMYKQHSQC